MANDKIYKTVRMAILISATFVAVVSAYYALNGRLGQTETDTTRNTVAIEKVDEKANSNEKAIIRLQGDVTFIKETVEKIEKKL